MKKQLLVLTFLLSTLLFGQKVNLQKLEDEIYGNNREGMQQLSQKKLLNILDDEGISDNEKIQVNLLMAATYRSLGDYSMAVNYLRKSEKIALELQGRDSLLININAQLAFVYFDNHDYKVSEKLMNRIKLQKFRALNVSDKAYIIMQLGYISFLNRNYNSAELEFAKALSLLKQVSKCNQPAVMVKQMQLYAAIGDLEKAGDLYDSTIRLADSCNILKYKIYATEEIKKIYQAQNNKDQVFKYSSRLDSLNTSYQRDKNLSALHIESEEFAEKKNSSKTNQLSLYLLILGLVLLLFVGIGIYFYRKSSGYKRQKELAEAEVKEMKDVLKEYSEKEFKNVSNENAILNSELLNERQKSLLQLLSEGLSNSEIAEKLFISESTVKYHVRNIYQILDLKDRKDLFKKLRN